MRYVLLLLMFFLTLSVQAQDKVILRNGDTLNVEVKKVGTNSIEYSFPNEELVTEKSKNEIASIIYASGRKEEFNQGIVVPKITSTKDWEKVVETYLESDVAGLTRVGELKATSGWGGSLGSSLGYKGAIKKLKKKAAKLGAGVLLIHGSPNKMAAAFGGGVQVIATAYK